MSRGILEPLRKWSCRRREREIILASSGDLAERARRGLERHVSRCVACRAELERATLLRSNLREIAELRGTPLRSVWSAVESALAQEGLAPEAAPRAARSTAGGERLPRLGWGVSPGIWRTPARLAALVAVFLGAAAWFGFSGPEEGASRAALEARWNASWDEFVSGAEPRTVHDVDPFAGEIPNPEVIDF